MNIADFDFELPPDRIAQRPVQPRTAARLLEIRANGVVDRHVGDLPDLLHPGDVIVANDTRVIPARLHGRRGAAHVEALLHRPSGPDRWRAFARPAKRLRTGDIVRFGDDLSAAVVGKAEGGEVELRFDQTGEALLAGLERHGEVPLPPYIHRAQGPDSRDRADYQTVYAREPGAVAAPTAGLHFTPELLALIRARGVATVTVTLHVGAGTFLPVRTEDPRTHRMHAEWGRVSAAAAETIAAARALGGRVVAIGTTSLRLLESAADADGTVRPFEGETDIFILPGYRFRAVDLLLTNFHLPRSTLFMLVSALAGTRRMQAAYAHAIRAGYRFYSYGDACLVPRLEDLP